MSVSWSENPEPIDRASAWARRLVSAEAARSGSTIRTAAATIGRRIKSSASSILALIYEPPKDVGAKLYEALREAVEREIKNEIKALENEMAAVLRGRLGGGHGEVEEIMASLAALHAQLKDRP